MLLDEVVALNGPAILSESIEGGVRVDVPDASGTSSVFLHVFSVNGAVTSATRISISVPVMTKPLTIAVAVRRSGSALPNRVMSSGRPKGLSAVGTATVWAGAATGVSARPIIPATASAVPVLANSALENSFTLTRSFPFF